MTTYRLSIAHGFAAGLALSPSPGVTTARRTGKSFTFIAADTNHRIAIEKARVQP